MKDLKTLPVRSSPCFKTFSFQKLLQLYVGLQSYIISIWLEVHSIQITPIRKGAAISEKENLTLPVCATVVFVVDIRIEITKTNCRTLVGQSIFCSLNFAFFANNFSLM